MSIIHTYIRLHLGYNKFTAADKAQLQAAIPEGSTKFEVSV